MRRPSSWHHLSNSWMWQNYHQWYNWCLLGNIKGAMSQPAHVQDFCLLCWFSQLSAILDSGNQADFWQQTSVYSTVLSEHAQFRDIAPLNHWQQDFILQTLHTFCQNISLLRPQIAQAFRGGRGVQLQQSLRIRRLIKRNDKVQL